MLAELLNEGELIMCRSTQSLLTAASARSLLVPMHKQRERNFKCGRIDYQWQIGLGAPLLAALHRQRERANINILEQYHQKI